MPTGKRDGNQKSNGESAAEAIYRVVASIPPGQLASYGQVAELAGLPRQARRVGRVLSQLPADTRLPWFRVVNAAGKISFPVGSSGYQRQLNHLIDEGSAFADGRLRWRDCRL
ncbi:methylated-DNA-protein-cysteine methyltransferase-like protein [Litorivivens lipolytica]|uniref:Methylated-DNA-protein-cysteine methyltransferase-like protein n=1 Tax=Litorivivens lipolytica TaxID=1524264 RepID=A0A7W4Z575_9GAMM|nr:methylated-DNA-protein-cysteine methyltransferase-like protein [Litorivivens lipolytica]